MTRTTKFTVAIKQDNGEVREIGLFSPSSKTLFLTRNRDKHFYRKLGAWGLDQEVLMRLIAEEGLEDIVLYDKKRHKRYITTSKEFIDNGLHLHFKPYRLQVFLKEEYWREG